MKSYVTLALCPICKEENGSILMDTRLKRDSNGQVKTRDTFDMHTIDPRNPCDKCRDKYLKNGVMLINPQTCSLAVIKDSAFRRIFNVSLPKGKIAFAEEDVISRLTMGK